MLTCTCPAATALTAITAVTCPENFGQIQKIAFMRLKDGSTKNSFTSSAAITLKASWTAAMAKTDSSKIVVSPYINNPQTEAGAARTVGGGNEGLGGVETVIGSEPTSFTAQFNGVPQASIIDMKKLMCEAQVNNLGVFLFNEAGQIGAIQDAATATTYYPIPIQSLFIGDKVFGNYENVDTNAISFSFPPNWSDHFAVATPSDFNPLTDL